MDYYYFINIITNFSSLVLTFGKIYYTKPTTRTTTTNIIYYYFFPLFLQQ